MHGSAEPARGYNDDMHVWSLFLRCAALLLALVAAPHAHAAAPMDERQALHLLSRLGYGPAPGELARVRATGAHAWVDGQLAPPPLPPYLRMRLRELAEAHAPSGEAALLRAVASPRQLEEVLASFWLGWFSEGQAVDADALRSALQPHVFGRYQDLAGQARARGLRLPAGGEHAALRALARHFVDAPPPALLRTLARVWDASGGGQRAVLRQLLTSRAFLAPAQWNSRRKDDFRFVASALRASGVWVEYVAPLGEYLRQPMGRGEREAFVERLADGGFSLGRAPPQRQRYASSAPPMRATVTPDPSQGMVSQPGPALMEAPTPSAIARAAAEARSVPADSERLRILLRSADFQRY